MVSQDEYDILQKKFDLYKDEIDLEMKKKDEKLNQLNDLEIVRLNFNLFLFPLISIIFHLHLIRN